MTATYSTDGRPATATPLCVLWVVVGLIAAVGAASAAPGIATAGVGNTIVVDDDKNQCAAADTMSIQAAANMAVDGDTVKVCAGTYEERVIIKDNVSFIAKSGVPVVMDGEQGSLGTGFVIQDADDVLIQGFEIQKYSVSGIDVNFYSTTDNVTIRNNYIHDIAESDALFEFGIIVKTYGGEESGGRILNNSIEDISGNGIRIFGPVTGITVSGNTVKRSTGDGISLIRVNESTFANNIVNNNGRDGISLFNSHNNTLTNNTANNNAENGITVRKSDNNTLADTIANNNGRTGIYLQNSNDNTFINSITNKNTFVGIKFVRDESRNNTFVNTTALGNGASGIYLDSSSINTTFVELNVSKNGKKGINHLGATGTNLTDVVAVNNGQWAFFSAGGTVAVVENLSLGSATVSFTSRDVALIGVSMPPEDPDGLVNIGQYLNAKSTDSNAYLDVEVNYDQSALGPITEDSLRLSRYNNADNSWKMVSGSTVNTAENYVSANITSFSTFALLGDVPGSTPVRGCTDITASGHYTLVDNITNSSATPCIDISASNVVFDGYGFTVDGRDDSNTIGIEVSNTSPTATNVTVRNVTVTDWGGRGILYSFAENGTVVNTHVESNFIGIEISGAATNVSVRNNTVVGNQLGIVATGNRAIVVDNNVSAPSLTSADGIRVGGDGSLVKNNTVSKTGTGIKVSGRNVTVVNNNASSNFRDGILIDASNHTIVRNNTANGNDRYGIYLTASSHTIVKNNTANGNGDSGIGIGFIQNPTPSLNNTFVNNTANVNGEHGFEFDKNAVGVVLRSNTADGNDNDGFYIDGSKDVVLIGNNATDNGLDGVSLSSPDDGLLIRNNVITGNGETGIYGSDIGNNTLIVGNNVSKNSFGTGQATTGISLQIERNITNLTITDNRLWDNGGDGIYIEIDDDNLELSDLVVSQNDVRNPTAGGIEIVASEENNALSDVRITDNTIDNAGSEGIIIDGAEENVTLDSIDIEGNTITDSGGDSIVIEADYNNVTVTHLRIADNTVENAGSDGIFIDVEGENAILDGTVIEGNTITNTDDEGIEIDGEDPNVTLNNIVIKENTITDAGDYSIEINAEAVDVTLDSLVIEGNTITNSNDDAIRLSFEADDTTLNDVTIEANTIESSGGNGVYLDGDDSGVTVNGLIIANNTFNGTVNGIDFDFSGDSFDGTLTGIEVRNNTITNTEDEAIEFIVSSPNLLKVDAVFESNTITDSGESGIQVDGGSGNVAVAILENNFTNNSIGVDIGEDTWVGGVEIHRNNFESNRNYGVRNLNVTNGTWVDATENWWGAASGPGSNGMNVTAPLLDPVTGALANGAGDNVSSLAVPFNNTSNVRFDAFLTEPFVPQTPEPPSNGGDTENDGGQSNGGGSSDGGNAPPSGTPDIVIVSAELSDDSITAGEQVRITATLRNDGDAPGEIEVRLFIDGAFAGESRIVTVPAGETVTIDISKRVRVPGEYTLRVDDFGVGTLVVEPPETPTDCGCTPTPADTPDGSVGEEPTPTDASDGSTPGGSTPDGSTPDEPTAQDPNKSPDGTPMPTGDGGPGFGVLLALVAMLGTALLALRRN